MTIWPRLWPPAPLPRRPVRHNPSPPRPGRPDSCRACRDPTARGGDHREIAGRGQAPVLVHDQRPQLRVHARGADRARVPTGPALFERLPESVRSRPLIRDGKRGGTLFESHVVCPEISAGGPPRSTPADWLLRPHRPCGRPGQCPEHHVHRGHPRLRLLAPRRARCRRSQCWPNHGWGTSRRIDRSGTRFRRVLETEDVIVGGRHARAAKRMTLREAHRTLGRSGRRGGARGCRRVPRRGRRLRASATGRRQSVDSVRRGDSWRWRAPRRWPGNVRRLIRWHPRFCGLLLLQIDIDHHHRRTARRRDRLVVGALERGECLRKGLGGRIPFGVTLCAPCRPYRWRFARR